MFFHWSLETQIGKYSGLQNALNKSSPTVNTLVRELFNCYNYFLSPFFLEKVKILNNMTAKLLFLLRLTLSKLFIKLFIAFLIKSSKKSWHQFCFIQSRNTTGRLMKNCLHRPIETLYSLTTGDLKNVYHNFKIIL